MMRNCPYTATTSRLLCIASRCKHGHDSVGELWRQFFLDPGQWWDHTAHKVNIKYPDFKHKTTGMALWIDKRSNPAWVNEQLSSLPQGSVCKSRFSWNSMLSACVKSDRGQDALELYNQMQAQGIQPDAVTFVRVLNACARLQGLEEGRLVHAKVIKSGCDSDLFVSSTLVDMYAKCGSLEDAQRVFCTMPVRNIVSWNAMLTGYVKCEEGEKALELFALMQEKGVKPNPVTFVVVLNACAIMVALEVGRQVHAQVLQTGCESDVVVGSTLVDMYAKCGRIDDAQQVFCRMPVRNVVSWSTMLAGYVKCKEEKKALELYVQMQERGVQPNPVTFVAVLTACAKLVALEEGRHVHCQVIQNGCESHAFVGSTLVDMYAKCGSMVDAQRVFLTLPNRHVVTWNAMLAAYVRWEEGLKALELFTLMEAEGLKPNSVTFVVVLNACAKLMMLEKARLVHMQVIQSHCESNSFVGNTLVHMYAKCGSIEDARRVFHAMPAHDVVSWNAMLAGYVQCEEVQKALELFQQMQLEGEKPDAFTFVVVLNACATMIALEEGKRVHAQVIQNGYESDVVVGTVLVHMYTKCGSIEDARRVFCTMPARDVVCWNAMIGGLAMHGHEKEAAQLFQEMSEAGVGMNAVTFLCLLSACSHGGLVAEGVDIFYSMESVYGISRTVEHYTCMVDLLGRAGHLDEAEDFLMREPIISEDVISLMALLSACRNHCNVEMGERIAKKVIELEPENSAAYVLLSNIYAAAGQWDK